MELFAGQVDWSGHVALMHGDENERRLGVASWVRCGLELGAKVLYIEPPFEPADRSFLGLLAEHAVEVGAALERRQLEVFVADDEAYDPDWQSGMVDNALADGYPAVQWSGEATTAWGVMSPAVHADVEWATDALCRSKPVSVLCQYAAGLPQATLQTVSAVHGDGLRESQLRTSQSPEGIALVGAVDASNHRVARAALLAAAHAQRRERLVVDLRQLEFLDVAGARALLTGTTPHRLRRGTVCLLGAHGSVERVLSLLGVNDADGFVVEAS